MLPILCKALFGLKTVVLASSLQLLLQVKFGGVVVACYVFTGLLWDSNISEIVGSLSVPTFYRGSKQQNYSGMYNY